MTKRTLTWMFFAILLACGKSAHAGESWPFQVKDISKEKGGSQLLTLVPLQAGTTFPLNCPTLTVHVRYDTLYRSIHMLFYGWKKVKKSEHRRAIEILNAARKSGAPIRFGRQGDGFGFKDGAVSCDIRSRGLTVVKESDGQEAIYSVYRRPKN